ncbi:class I SAM-dependent methyltransferase [Actinospica sp. MGRD01-02]|uniref:Class I SAM-dependent methyltransferase n=1 Tax=Actinospica acidithermotolerans TaxID=2828514 RepID=A0A941EBE8_9ACTN|nr:class I SAM-dependent methyltransferase [Actinospica acidithermotolerans]MBR7827498.1 class I SAM-dependent methyltransferase [Actinospica acidithermotolerans]
MGRTQDGSAGDADYGRIGTGYAGYRRPEPRIAAVIEQALAGAKTLVNVGAGTGSYESQAFEVTAVEPSATMRAQRPAHLSPAIDAVAEALPFPDDAFDAAMTTYSVHQWSDLKAGLREMRRVARGPVVVVGGDPDRVRDYWLAEYAPEMMEIEARRYPTIGEIAETLGGIVEVTQIPIPFDCTDGFIEAYYGRPEALLDPEARKACSAWSLVDEQRAARYVEALSEAIESGAWDARHGHLRTQPSFDGSLVLIKATPA